MPYLAAMSLAVAVCVYGYGGVTAGYMRAAWVCIGATGAALFTSTRTVGLAPRLARPLFWSWMALLLYTFVQTASLPREYLSLISPQAAGMHDAVNQLAGGSPLFSISIMRPATMEHLARLIGYFLVFLIARELCWRADRRQWMIVAPLVGLACLEALAGITQFAAGGGARPATGTYVNRNHFAGLLEMMFPFAAVYFCTAVSQRNTIQALIGGSLAALLGTGILCSLSRMAAAILFGSCILIVAVLIRPRRIALPAAVAATAVVFWLFVPAELLHRFASVPGAARIAEDTRVQLWNDTLRLAADYPVTGTGLGAYAAALPRYQTVELDRTVGFAHNDYLQVMVELGMAGILPIAGIVVGILHPVVRTMRRGTPVQRAFATACLTSLLTMLVHSLADFNLYIPANAIVLSWVAGVAVMIPWQPTHWTDEAPHLMAQHRSRRISSPVAGTVWAESPSTTAQLCVTERSERP